MKRKIISILLVLTLLIGLFPITAVHAESKHVVLTITPNKTTAKAGDEVEFTVSLTANQPITSLQLDLFVPEGLTYVKKSGVLTDSFVSNVLATDENDEEYDPEVAEISLTEQNYARNYITGKSKPNSSNNDKAANEILIICAATKTLQVSPNLVKTGTVNVATFKCTVDSDSVGDYKTTVDKTVFTGLNGSSTFTVASDQKTIDSKAVTVETDTPQTIPVSGVVVDEDGLNIDMSTTTSVKLNGHVTPENATNQGLTWESSNTAVATVDSNGNVTIIGKGSAIITAKSAEDSTLSDTCNINVTCGHNGEKDVHEEVAAKCEEVGHNAYTKCKVCGEIISGADTEIPAKGHNYGDLIPKVSPTHTQEQLIDGTIAHYHCTDCGKYFTSDKVEIDEKDLVIKAEHDYGDGWKSDENNHWHECVGCGGIKDSAPHEGGEATCKHKAVCTVCGNEYGEFDSTKHGETEVRNAKEATCTEDGYTGDTYCKDCEEKIADGTVINALGHTGGEATCKHKAVCTRCNQEYGELDANNHKHTEIRNAKDPTTREKGYTGDTYCKDCDQKIKDGEEIPVKDPEIVVKPEEGKEVDESVIEATEDVLEKIAKGEDVKIDGDVNAIKEMVLDEDKDFNVELNVDKVTEEEVGSDKELVEEKLKDDEKIAGFFEVEIIIKVDGKEIATITETDKQVTVALAIPSDLPEVPEGLIRTFFIMRIHDYNGTKKAERIPTTVSGDQAIGKSDKFSTYVLAYVDEEKPVEPTPTPTTGKEPVAPTSDKPNTGDNFNITLWVSILIVSGISFIVIGKCKTGKRSKHSK